MDNNRLVSIWNFKPSVVIYHAFGIRSSNVKPSFLPNPSSKILNKRFYFNIGSFYKYLGCFWYRARFEENGAIHLLRIAIVSLLILWFSLNGREGVVNN